MSLPLQRSPLVLNWLNQGVALVRSWPWKLLGSLGSLALLLALALLGYQATAKKVTLYVDGGEFTLRTHQRQVGGILEQAGLTLQPGDQVSPPVQAPWHPGQSIVIERAMPVTVRADGREVHFFGQPRSLLEVLAHTHVTLGPGDIVYVNNEVVPESAYANEKALQAMLAGQSAAGHRSAPQPKPAPLQVEVQRAIPLFIQDGELPLEVRVTASTVGTALEQVDLQIYQADRVYPAMDMPISPNMHVRIERAMPVHLHADGRSLTTRTWAQNVAEVFKEVKLSLGPMDIVTPPLDTALQAGTTIRIVRVTTLDLVNQIAIPYEKRQEADPTMELDHQYLRPGEEGIREEVTRVTYEDGKEVGREFLGEQVTKEPIDEVFYYGTNIVIRTLETPYGTFEYWRKFRVLATHYYPSTCDKDPGHPLYGITYTGRWATRGIIAVDPRIIPLHSKMYVPGYGPGAAEDIGGAIKGLHIDVCFDDADQGKGLWDTRYVDVYLLVPVPRIGSFPWILPGSH